MPHTSDKFLGNWTLVPELCQYQDGHAPLSGAYKIAMTKEKAQFGINWTDEKNKTHEIEFAGPVDGTVNPLNGGKMEWSCTRIDHLRLDSSMYHEDEGATRNFQVYRRS